MNGSNRRGLGAFSILIVLTIVAFYALVLAKPSYIAAQSVSMDDELWKSNVMAVPHNPCPNQTASIGVGEANASDIHLTVLSRSNEVVPVSNENGCTSCHSDAREAATKYPVGSAEGVKTNRLTLQEFLEQGQYIPLLTMQRSIYCADSHANPPSNEYNDVIKFLQVEQHSGT